jgi:hypothetical protein
MVAHGDEVVPVPGDRRSSRQSSPRMRRPRRCVRRSQEHGIADNDAAEERSRAGRSRSPGLAVGRSHDPAMRADAHELVAVPQHRLQTIGGRHEAVILPCGAAIGGRRDKHGERVPSADSDESADISCNGVVRKNWRRPICPVDSVGRSPDLAELRRQCKPIASPGDGDRRCGAGTNRPVDPVR